MLYAIALSDTPASYDPTAHENPRVIDRQTPAAPVLTLLRFMCRLDGGVTVTLIVQSLGEVFPSSYTQFAIGTGQMLFHCALCYKEPSSDVPVGHALRGELADH